MWGWLTVELFATHKVVASYIFFGGGKDKFWGSTPALATSLNCSVASISWNSFFGMADGPVRATEVFEAAAYALPHRSTGNLQGKCIAYNADVLNVFFCHRLICLSAPLVKPSSSWTEVRENRRRPIRLICIIHDVHPLNRNPIGLDASQRCSSFSEKSRHRVILIQNTDGFGPW